MFTLTGVQKGKTQTNPDQIIQINTFEKHQTITGFGASLAYYENWLIAHPNRNQIYDVIFEELSLDILRVRNTFGYDEGMIDRVKQFANAAKLSLGHPIDIMVTSWGPPAYLKSNNDRNNGGTLKYEVLNGKVNFNYSGFAKWWSESLDNYNNVGIFPKYISIQNEPDWKATYESCLLRPAETITNTDTIAGYNKALDAVYDSIQKRENPPHFLGPECIGIGYNTVENYINALDLSRIFGISHHLYHGAESGTVENDPFTSSNYAKVGNFHPEKPHFQTEYSRTDWFSLAAMMFQTLAEENATAFLYWDLIWSEGGLVNLHFPWDRSRWANSLGYNRTKDFYVFKHYSKFIHPGWKRITTTENTNPVKTAAFSNNSGDSLSFIAINRSLTDTFKIKLQIQNFNINQANTYTTTELVNFENSDYLSDSILIIPPKSISTVELKIAEINTGLNDKNKSFSTVSNFPNPFKTSTKMNFWVEQNDEFVLKIFDINGHQIETKSFGSFSPGKHQITYYRKNKQAGIYFYQLEWKSGKTNSGKFIIQN